MKLLEPEGYRRGEEIALALTMEGMEDMSDHLIPRRHSWFRYGRTWSMVQLGRDVGSQTYYILGADCCIFWDVFFRDPRHNLDHYLVLGCLRSAPLREHSEYLRRRKHKCEAVGAGGISEGGGNRAGANYGRDGGYVGPLNPTPTLMVPVREDVEHGPVGEGCGFPDVLYPRGRLLYLLGCVLPGPQA